MPKVEPGHGLVRAQECFLRHVLCLRTASNEMVRETVDSLLVPPHKDAECVAIASLRSFHSFPVAFLNGGKPRGRKRTSGSAVLAVAGREATKVSPGEVLHRPYHGTPRTCGGGASSRQPLSCLGAHRTAPRPLKPTIPRGSFGLGYNRTDRAGELPSIRIWAHRRSPPEVRAGTRACYGAGMHACIRWARTFALVCAAFVGGALTSVRAGATSHEDATYAPLDQLARVITLVEANYVEATLRSKLTEGAIKGLVGELHPHSSYLTANELAQLRGETEGRYAGVGLEVDVRNDTILVIAPIDGFPLRTGGHPSRRRDPRH